MKWGIEMKRIVLIPAYEPDEKLLELIKNINKDYDIVLVDDGSTNRFILDSIPSYVHIIKYKENKGKGYALKQGLKYIKEHYKNYIIVTMDADGQHDFTDAIKLCDYEEKNLDTLVIGKRTWDNKTPLSNRLGNKITRSVFKRKTGQLIYDTQSGLRCFSYKIIDYMLSISGSRYEYEMNVLLNLKRNNIKVHEIDIKTIYLDGNKRSHFRALKDSYKIYK